MKTRKYNIKIAQGSSYSRTIYIVYYLQGVKTPVNLSAYTAQAEIRLQPSDTNVEAEIACVIDAVNGTITISLTNTQTLALTNNHYFWDLFITSSTDRIQVMYGEVFVNPEITETIGG
jgi:hypothetical protein